MSGRAENLEDVLNGKSVGAPARGHGIKIDDRGRQDKPLPDLAEKERPGGYVGRRRRGERD